MSYPDFDPLLLRFLAKLHATPIPDTQDSFELQPSCYTACVKSLEKDDHEVWAYVLDKLRYIKAILHFPNLKVTNTSICRHDLIGDRTLIVKMTTVSHEVLLAEIH